MFRPSDLKPSASRRALGRNLALDLVAATGLGVTLALVGALLPTIARRGGLEPIGLSALAAAPFIANLLGAFAGRYGPRSPRQLALARGIGAASLLLLFVLPVPAAMIGVAMVFWMSLAFGSPFHLRLWSVMYPARLVGRMVGFIGMARAGAGALAAFGGGLLADRLGGPPAVAVAGIVGIACALAYAGLRANTTERPPMFSARDSFRALRERPVLARVTLAQGFYGGGLVAASPLYALVYVDRLDLSLADVGVIGILASASTTVAFLIWGAVADRSGPLVVLRVGAAIGLVGLLAYAVASSVVVLWLGAIAFGIASASIDVGIASAVTAYAPLQTRAAASAGLNSVTGARGIVMAFLMGALLELGIVDVTSGLLVCAAITAVGVVLYVRTVAVAASGGWAQDPGFAPASEWAGAPGSVPGEASRTVPAAARVRVPG